MVFPLVADFFRPSVGSPRCYASLVPRLGGPQCLSGYHWEGFFTRLRDSDGHSSLVLPNDLAVHHFDLFTGVHVRRHRR